MFVIDEVPFEYEPMLDELATSGARNLFKFEL